MMNPVRLFVSLGLVFAFAGHTSLGAVNDDVPTEDERSPNGPQVRGALVSPLTAFGCDAGTVNKSVQENIRSLALAIQASSNPACNLARGQMPSLLPVGPLIQGATINPAQQNLQQLKAQLADAQALEANMANPPPGFNASQYSLTNLQGTVANLNEQIQGANSLVASSNSVQNVGNAARGVTNTTEYVTALSTAMADGCLDGKNPRIAANVVGLAASFMGGPVGLGVGLGSQLLSTFFAFREARKQNKQRQSADLDLLQTEIGLKCFLMRAGITQCNIDQERQNNICQSEDSTPLSKGAVGDLELLQKSIENTPLTDRNGVKTEDRAKLIRGFFPSAKTTQNQISDAGPEATDTPFELLLKIHAQLGWMRQILASANLKDIDHSEIDVGQLNDYIGQLDALISSGTELQKKEKEATASSQDELKFLGAFNRLVFDKDKSFLPNMGELIDSFHQFYKDKLATVTDLNVPTATLNFLEQNGKASMSTIVSLSATAPYNRQQNNDNLRLGYRSSEQLEKSFGDKIQAIIDRASRNAASKGDSYISALDQENLNFFCMSLLNLPSLGGTDKKGGNDYHMNFDKINAACANATISQAGTTLSYQFISTQPYQKRVCSFSQYQSKSGK